MLDDLLFLGTDYEAHFDRFEVMLALEYAEQLDTKESGHVWGPPGRFAYKHRTGSGPFNRVITEAKTLGDAWPPIRAGLFGGSIERFKDVASEYSKLVSRLGWW